MRRLFLILALFALATPAAARSPKAGAPAQIRAVIARMQDAWNRGDFRGYMAGFKNPGVTFVSRGRMLNDWGATLAHYERDYATPERRGRLTFSDIRIEMLAPDAAQLISHYRLERAVDPQDGINTRLFRKIGGRWVIALNHVSSIEPPDEDAEAAAKEVRAVLEAQVRGWNAGDLDAYMAGFWNSPDLLYISGANVSRGWIATRDHYRARYDSRAKMGTLAYSDLEITPRGRDTATVLGRWRLTRAGDAPGGVFTLTLRRIDGVWRIVVNHVVLE